MSAVIFWESAAPTVRTQVYSTKYSTCVLINVVLGGGSGSVQVASVCVRIQEMHDDDLNR